MTLFSASLTVRVPKRRSFVKEIVEDLPMINKEDDSIIDNCDVDAVIRVEMTNELSPSDIHDTNAANSCYINNTIDHKRYRKRI